jgi:hypothetical protein
MFESIEIFQPFTNAHNGTLRVPAIVTAAEVSVVMATMLRLTDMR